MLRAVAHGTFGPDSGNRKIYATLGSTQIFESPTLTNTSDNWILTVDIMCWGSAVQYCTSRLEIANESGGSNSINIQHYDSTEDMSLDNKYLTISGSGAAVGSQTGDVKVRTFALTNFTYPAIAPPSEWTLRVSDSFTDTPLADLATHTPELGGVWNIVYGTLRINIDGNQVNSSSAGVALNATSFSDDQAVEMTMNGGALDLYARVSGVGGGQGYVLECIYGFSTRLWWGSGGGDLRQHLIGTGPNGTPGDTFRLEIIGSSLEVFQNGSSIITVTDANVTSGDTVGFSVGSGDDSDDFKAYDQ